MQSLEPNFKSPLAVVAHDAGAANLILGWLKYNSVQNIRYSLKGPALDIFSTFFSSFVNTSINLALENAAMLLSGTSSDKINLEHEARLYAQKKNIYSVGVLDNWSNFDKRFTRNNSLIVPNEIWVVDDSALKIATEYFPIDKVIKKHNSYLDQQVKIIEDLSFPDVTSKFKNVLYLLEPIHEVWGNDSVPGEFLALDYFVESMSSLDLPRDTKIILRLHPSEKPNKYDRWIKFHNDLNVSINIKNSLSDLIAWADIVVGCHTFAMIIALHAKRYTLSSIPPYAPAGNFPYEGIFLLRDLQK